MVCEEEKKKSLTPGSKGKRALWWGCGMQSAVATGDIHGFGDSHWGSYRKEITDIQLYNFKRTVLP